MEGSTVKENQQVILHNVIFNKELLSVEVGSCTPLGVQSILTKDALHAQRRYNIL
jgi:hypothetical protein